MNNIIEKIGKWKDNKKVKKLINDLENKDKCIRQKAAGVLGKMGDNTAVEPLIKVLKEEDKDFQKIVINSLGEIGDKRAIEALIKVLACKKYDMRLVVDKALIRLGFKPTNDEKGIRYYIDNGEFSKCIEIGKESVHSH